MRKKNEERNTRKEQKYKKTKKISICRGRGGGGGGGGGGWRGSDRPAPTAKKNPKGNTWDTLNWVASHPTRIKLEDLEPSS